MIKWKIDRHTLGIIATLILLINEVTIVRYKIIRYKKFMPPDKPLYQ